MTKIIKTYYKETQETKYQSIDGKIFYSENDCLYHERHLHDKNCTLDGIQHAYIYTPLINTFNEYGKVMIVKLKTVDDFYTLQNYFIKTMSQYSNLSFSAPQAYPTTVTLAIGEEWVEEYQSNLVDDLNTLQSILKRMNEV